MPVKWLFRSSQVGVLLQWKLNTFEDRITTNLKDRRVKQKAESGLTWQQRPVSLCKRQLSLQLKDRAHVTRKKLSIVGYSCVVAGESLHHQQSEMNSSNAPLLGYLVTRILTTEKVWEGRKMFHSEYLKSCCLQAICGRNYNTCLVYVGTQNKLLHLIVTWTTLFCFTCFIEGQQC